MQPCLIHLQLISSVGQRRCGQPRTGRSEAVCRPLPSFPDRSAVSVPLRSQQRSISEETARCLKNAPANPHFRPAGLREVCDRSSAASVTRKAEKHCAIGTVETQRKASETPAKGQRKAAKASERSCCARTGPRQTPSTPPCRPSWSRSLSRTAVFAVLGTKKAVGTTRRGSETTRRGNETSTGTTRRGSGNNKGR